MFSPKVANSTQDKAFFIGAEDRKNGYKLCDNPYNKPEYDDLRQSWEEGWKFAEWAYEQDERQMIQSSH